jgi:hypothetical protein
MPEPNSVAAGSKLVPKAALFFGVFMVLIAAALFMSHSRAFVLATSHLPEPYTELYFANADRLPAAAAADTKLPVSFVLHNVESKNFTYKYQIIFIDGAGKTTDYGAHDVYIPQGQTQIVTEDILIPSGTGRGEVRVNIINKGQSIHFWLERSTS